MTAAKDLLRWTLPDPDELDRSRRGSMRPLPPVVLTRTPVRMDLEEYLVLEERSEHKHEYVDGIVYAMAGASDAHVSITQALTSRLLPLVRAKGCRVYSMDMALEVYDRSDSERLSARFYPDVIVTCSEADKSRRNAKREPSILIEVLSDSSDSTAKHDRSRKLEHYLAIPSLLQYWLVSQDRRKIEIYHRDGDDWRFLHYESLDDAVMFASLGAGISLREIYEDVLFESIRSK